MMKFKIRYLLVLLIFLVAMVVNLDRSNISIAGSYIAADFHISIVELGWCFSAFMIGYAAFLIPSGWIAGKWGPRRTLTEWRPRDQCGQLASHVTPLLEQDRDAVGQVALGDRSGFGDVLGERDTAAVVSTAGGLHHDRAIDPRREGLDVGRVGDLGEPRNRSSEFLEPTAHHQLVLGVQQRPWRRCDVHALIDQGLQKVGGDVFVVERQGRGADGDAGQGVGVGVRTDDHVGSHLGRGIVRRSGQHAQCLAKRDRGLVGHPGQLSAADHGYDWRCTHGAYVVTVPILARTRRDLHGYASRLQFP